MDYLFRQDTDRIQKLKNAMDISKTHRTESVAVKHRDLNSDSHKQFLTGLRFIGDWF